MFKRLALLLIVLAPALTHASDQFTLSTQRPACAYALEQQLADISADYQDCVINPTWGYNWNYGCAAVRDARLSAAYSEYLACQGVTMPW